MCVCVRRMTHKSPPEGVGVRFKLLIVFLLRQINEETCKDQTQEANVPGSNQLLKRGDRLTLDREECVCSLCSNDLSIHLLPLYPFMEQMIVKRVRAFCQSKEALPVSERS